MAVTVTVTIAFPSVIYSPFYDFPPALVSCSLPVATNIESLDFSCLSASGHDILEAIFFSRRSVGIKASRSVNSGLMHVTTYMV